MNFTKKHEEWSLFFGLRPSTRLIWSCIIRKTKGDRIEEIEIDLKKINQWIARKRGKGFDRKTLKEAIVQLSEKTEGLIVVQKKYTWYCYKILVRPLFFLEQKKSQDGETSHSNSNGNSRFNGVNQEQELKQQQQNLTKIDKLLRQVGLRYDADALSRIWQLSGKCIDRITQAIELMLYRHSSVTKIERPHGFIIECLKRNWVDGFNIFYEPELPSFNSISQLREYVGNIKRSLVTT